MKKYLVTFIKNYEGDFSTDVWSNDITNLEPDAWLLWAMGNYWPEPNSSPPMMRAKIVLVSAIEINSGGASDILVEVFR